MAKLDVDLTDQDMEFIITALENHKERVMHPNGETLIDDLIQKLVLAEKVDQTLSVGDAFPVKQLRMKCSSCDEVFIVQLSEMTTTYRCVECGARYKNEYLSKGKYRWQRMTDEKSETD